MENDASALYDLRPKTQPSHLSKRSSYDIFERIIEHLGNIHICFLSELEIDTTLMSLWC